jgi:two-component system sensor histidine kinase KdpD
MGSSPAADAQRGKVSRIRVSVAGVGGVAAAGLAVGIVTAVCLGVHEHRLEDVTMLYLLGVVGVAMRFGYVPSLVAAALSVAALDFFFTEPFMSFEVADRRNILTFVIMLFVAVVISHLMERRRRAAVLTVEVQRAQLEVDRERLRNALLSSVSHDLKTPLAVVKGAASAVLEGGDDLAPERRREYLETISEEASRLNRLVRNLLDMTSLEAGALRARTEWQPLEEVVGVALSRLNEQLQRRPVRIEIAPDASLVPFDAVLIEQVLVNLIENACRYTPGGGALGIRAAAVEGAVEVEVNDAGPGVPPGEEERVFEKFRRAASQTPGGMGLGLTICRGIVEVHGGRIWCQNRPGGGASFRFRLPRSTPPAEFESHALPEEVQA